MAGEGRDDVVQRGRTGQGDSKSFEVKVVARQSSAFSPLLFAIVIHMVTKKARGERPSEVLYIDVIVLKVTTEEEPRRKLRNDARARTKGERQ